MFHKVIIPVASLAHLDASKLLSVSIKRMKGLSDLNPLKEVIKPQDLELTLEVCRLMKRSRLS